MVSEIIKFFELINGIYSTRGMKDTKLEVNYNATASELTSVLSYKSAEGVVTFQRIFDFESLYVRHTIISSKDKIIVNSVSGFDFDSDGQSMILNYADWHEEVEIFGKILICERIFIPTNQKKVLRLYRLPKTILS
jgi:hypothetical protein